MGNSLKKSASKEDKLYTESDSMTPTKRTSKGKASEAASKIKSTITNITKAKSSDDITAQVKGLDFSPSAPPLPGGDYGHFNQKLSIDDFDLLKVICTTFSYVNQYLNLYFLRCWVRAALARSCS